MRCPGGTWYVEWKPEKELGLKVLTQVPVFIWVSPEQTPRQKPGCRWLMWEGEVIQGRKRGQFRGC